ncbi:MAG: threonine dehydratase [Rhodothermales bacterium]
MEAIPIRRPMPTFHDLVDQAERFLEPIIRTTPVEPCPTLSSRLGVPVWLKLEFLQVTGSFKIRGAYFALARLNQAGVRTAATCSAGNHGVGMAYAARALGMRVQIYVPREVDPAKVMLLESLGADVVKSALDGFDETELWAMDQISRDGLPFVSAYDDEVVLAGNGGTLMREMRRQVPGLHTVVVPVGGGGMSGGIALSDAAPSRLVAAQTAASPALALSLERGKAVTRLKAADTLAGGLEGGIGETGFAALRGSVSQVVQVSEPALKHAVRWMLAEHRFLIEPSSAVPIAACLDPGIEVEGETVVVISGRNIGIETLKRILS